jgi:hypothetical protein
LLAAFDRFMVNAAKSDPQCWAKIAIIKAVAALGHDDRDIYLRGLRHIQQEPVWGGRRDTAGPLRANCALALVACRSVTDLDALEHLIEPLFDEDKNVRIETARAVARIDRREAALVLRTRALSGEREPEPLGAVLAGILSIEGRHGIPFVARFLDREGDAAHEAALALGATHEIAAFDALRAALERGAAPALRTTLMTAVALTRLPEAVDFLIAQADAGSHDALQALKTVPLTEAQQVRLDGLSPLRH